MRLRANSSFLPYDRGYLLRRVLIGQYAAERRLLAFGVRPEREHQDLVEHRSIWCHVISQSSQLQVWCV